MPNDNDRTGMLLDTVLLAGWQPEFATDCDHVVLTMRRMRRWKPGMLGGHEPDVEPREYVGACPAEALEAAVREIEGGSDGQ